MSCVSPMGVEKASALVDLSNHEQLQDVDYSPVHLPRLMTSRNDW
jgi:hypothetical protein